MSKEWFALDVLAFETGKYIVPQRIKEVIVTHLGTDRVPPRGGGSSEGWRWCWVLGPWLSW